jgi:hypothetical protein
VSTIEITDPADWRAGDHAEWRDPDYDAMVTGTFRVTEINHRGLLLLGPLVMRWPVGSPRAGTITVTREVPDIEEPMGLGAVVTFRDAIDEQITYGFVHIGGGNWTSPSWDERSWTQVLRDIGPAVAVLSPGVGEDGAR